MRSLGEQDEYVSIQRFKVSLILSFFFVNILHPPKFSQEIANEVRERRRSLSQSASRRHPHDDHDDDRSQHDRPAGRRPSSAHHQAAVAGAAGSALDGTQRSASPPAAATDIDAHAAKRRIAAVVRQQVAAQREGCTFAPATNARSRELVEKSALFKQVRAASAVAIMPKKTQNFRCQIHECFCLC
jgi:hypothetical protein